MTSGLNLKQPHEGIVGVARTDDLLSREESAVARRDMMVGMAYLMRTATLVGDPAPIVQRMYARMTSPVVGDLVVEVGAAYARNPETRFHGFGILLEKRVEWATSDEEWEEYLLADASVAEDGRFTDTAWYVQYGPDPADVCRWVDCDFFAVLADPREFSYAPKS